MTIETSARYGLPLLASGQAQKEIAHNEALALIDIATNAVVQGIGIDTPAVSPAIGQCWIVGDSPTGVWAGRAAAIAGWTSGGWRFVQPFDGLTAWDAGSGVLARCDGASWAIEPAVGNPAGGTTIDTEVRTAVSAILAALRNHGLIES